MSSFPFCICLCKHSLAIIASLAYFFSSFSASKNEILRGEYQQIYCYCCAHCYLLSLFIGIFRAQPCLCVVICKQSKLNDICLFQPLRWAVSMKTTTNIITLDCADRHKLNDNSTKIIWWKVWIEHIEIRGNMPSYEQEIEISHEVIQAKAAILINFRISIRKGDETGYFPRWKQTIPHKFSDYSQFTSVFFKDVQLLWLIKYFRMD